jgi:hypothetical protein
VSKYRIDLLERAVREGNAVAKDDQTKCQIELRSVMRKKESDRVQLEQEVKSWEDFREKREDIVLGKMSHDRSQKEKAEHALRDFQRVKEEHLKRKRRLQDMAAHAGAVRAEDAGDDDPASHAAGASNALKQLTPRKPASVRPRATAAEKAAGGYSDSVEILRARRECWTGHGFKAASSSVGGSAASGGRIVQPEQKL